MVTKLKLEISPFEKSINPLVRYLTQIGFTLNVFKYDDSKRIVHIFSNDSLEIALSVSKNGDNPVIIFSKNENGVYIENFIYYNGLENQYLELLSENISLDNFALRSLDFIKNEILTLNKDYDFSTIFCSSDFEGIISKFLIPFMTKNGFSVRREKNPNCSDNSFIFDTENISLHLVSASRLDSGSIFFKVKTKDEIKDIDYSFLLKKLFRSDNISKNIAGWEAGFNGGNYYQVVCIIKDTLDPIVVYLQKMISIINSQQ